MVHNISSALLDPTFSMCMFRVGAGHAGGVIVVEMVFVTPPTSVDGLGA